MNRLRNRLIVAFVAATLIPLTLTLWIMMSLLEYSLERSAVQEVDRLSRTLEETGREYYQQAREALRADAAAGAAPSRVLHVAGMAAWPEDVTEFWESGDAERFALAGTRGDRLEYLARRDDGVWIFARSLGNVRMEDLTGQYREARSIVDRAAGRDLRRGINATLIVLVAAVWLVAFVWLIYLASRMSRPIQQLTAGLAELASGNFGTRLTTHRNDEIGRAIMAFNNTAAQLEQSRDRLVYLTQVASWQMLARKMAHELKNSLTPIRLTAEEILARQTEADRPFMEKAVQIVVEEVDALERRVRAFSEFSSEPVVRLQPLAVNALLEERIAFLRSGHPEVRYNLALASSLPAASGDPDRVRGILNNLIENAAEAAGAGGCVLGVTFATETHICIEIHDSGPGLQAEARASLFEPSISFKPGGMGLGLSIARKDALVCGGDLQLVDGRLGGAAFRVTLPRDR